MIKRTLGGSQSISKGDLTTSFNQNFTVRFDAHGNSAKIEYTEDEWYDKTTIKITVLSPGTTTAHFTNTVDSKTFDIIIYVTN